MLPLPPYLRSLPARIGALLRRRGPGGSTRSTAALLGELGPARDELLAFGRKSDVEFTHLAGAVGSLASQLGAIKQQTDFLDRTLNDRDEDRAVSSAYTLYKSSVDLVHSSVGIAMSEQQEMTVVEKGLHRLCAARDDFKRTSLMFRMLAMGVRMEAARLPPEDQGTFLNVALDIAGIERQMAETTEAAFERIAQVVAETEAERVNVAHLQGTLHDRAHHSIRTIQTELSKLEETLKPCATGVQEIVALLQNAHGELNGMIRALQFQDIVRQKLEHVGEGFSDLLAHAEKVTREHEPLNEALVHRAAQVQSAQLGNARLEIERAAGEVTGGLQGLLQQAEVLLERFNALHSSASHAFRDCRIADLFRTEIQNLSQIAQQSEQTNQTISNLALRIEEIVNVFGRDIGKHQFDVRLVSLNAQIAAARLPSADALNRIAEEAILMSGTNGGLTQALATELAQTLERLNGIKVEAQDFLRTVSIEKSALEFGATDVSTKLHRLGETIQASSAALNADFQRTTVEVKALLEQLEFPTEIESSCRPAQAACAALLAATGGSAGGALDGAALEQLATHQRRYTMAAEHDTHQAATHRTARPANSAPALPAPEVATPAIVAPPPPTEANPAASPGPTPSTSATTPPAAAESFGDGIELF